MYWWNPSTKLESGNYFDGAGRISAWIRDTDALKMTTIYISSDVELNSHSTIINRVMHVQVIQWADQKHCASLS